MSKINKKNLKCSCFRCICKKLKVIKRRVDLKVKELKDQLDLYRRNPTFIHILLYIPLLFLYKLSPYSYLKAAKDNDDKSFKVEEYYSITCMIILLMLVFVGPWLILSGQIVSQFWLLCSISLFMLFFPIWRIIDLVVAHFIILFIYSEANIDLSRDGYIRIRHPQRWIAFLAFDFLQIVLSFALVYLFMDIFCSSDNPPFKEHFYTTKHLVSSLESLEIGINSFYFSLVTIVTLGYGDFSPTTYLGRLVVSLEILIGIFFLFFVFVIALPTIRTTNTMGKKWKN